MLSLLVRSSSISFKLTLETVVTYIDGDFEAVIDAIASGRMQPAGIITKVMRPDEVAEQGFKASTFQIKILVDMSKVAKVK